ncbi:MAG: hypothetical protein ABIO24_04725, partial [Saprospiraceae bacterium]
LVKTTAAGQITGCLPQLLVLSVADLPVAPSNRSLTLSAFPAGVSWNLTTQPGQLTAADYCTYPAPVDSISGIINEYTPVIGFNCDSTLLQVGSGAGFAPGDEVLLIQMQGAAVDLSNSADFGTVLDYGSAGNYEFNRIQSVTGNEIQLQFTLGKSYAVAGKVQLVRVPEYTDAAVGDLSCQPWDGNTGGVLVLDIANTLTLMGDLDVNAKGFRGGQVADASVSIYDQKNYFYPPDPNVAAAKGEGIAIIPADKSFGRGRVANGGGGGNAHNAGGGGGSNAGNGGDGGEEVFLAPNPPILGTKGLGGAKTLELSVDRAVLGGGGGAGHSNDLKGSSGGNGGGIIILKAKTIDSNNHTIWAGGENIFGPGGNAINDGQGGGGGGGTILLATETVLGNLVCNVQGGRGGDCLYFLPEQIIGSGGGGSGGKVWTPQSFPNLQVETDGGIHGLTNQNLDNGATDGEPGKFLTGMGSVLTDTLVSTIPVVELVIINPTCQTPGRITILNEPNGSFSLNNGPMQTDPTFDNLGAGQYLVMVKTAQGCTKDSLVNLSRQDSLIETFTEIPLCPNDTILLGGVAYTQPDTVVLTFPASTGGCDTLATYVIIRAENVLVNTTLSFCPGSSVVVNGVTYTQADTIFTYLLPAGVGCDTMVKVSLHYSPQPMAAQTIAFCPGSSVTIDGMTYTQPGTVLGIIPATAGCDTLATYLLEFLPQPTSIQTIEFCKGDTVILGGATYTHPGTVNVVIPSTTGGCDTLAIYNLQYLVPSQPTSISLNCPADIYVDVDPGQTAATVNYTQPAAATDCPCPGLNLSLQQGLASGSHFPLG